MKKLNKKVIIVSLVIFLIIVGSIFAFYPTTERKIEACFREDILGQLKAPSTARFVEKEPIEMFNSSVDDKPYYFQIFQVEAQNNFGVPLKNEWRCTITPSEDDLNSCEVSCEEF